MVRPRESNPQPSALQSNALLDWANPAILGAFENVVEFASYKWTYIIKIVIIIIIITIIRTNLLDRFIIIIRVHALTCAQLFCWKRETYYSTS